MNPLSILAISLGFAVVPVAATFHPANPGDPPAAQDKVNRYIGAKACKNCHSGAEKGEAYDKWAKTEHAKAYETLGSDKAKEVAKKLGVEDPQKSEKCLKCHETAYGVPAAEIKRGFKAEDGVQCESCHGPGENHFKVRFAESQKGGTPAPVGEGEIQKGRTMDLCKKCHNTESPTYKEFCLKERMEKIEHLDPRQKRTEEQIKKLRETCFPECPKCSKKDGEKKEEGK